MGTIAARDCLRVLQLTEQVTAAMLLGACQGVNLRLRRGEIQRQDLSSAVVTTLDQVAEIFPFLEEDRAMEQILRQTVELIQQQHWVLYE